MDRRKFLKTSGMAAAALQFSRLEARAVEESVTPLIDVKGVSFIPSVCGLCSARCLIVGKIVNGILVKIEGNPKSPFNGRKVCARGQAAVAQLYDPDRLKYPMKRIGKRGQGRWARISWGEAIDTIAGAIEKTVKKIGTDGLGLLHGGPSSKYIRELFQELGASNICDSTTEYCFSNQDLAYKLTFGISSQNIQPAENIKSIILMGSHLGENIEVPELRKVMTSLAQGTKLVVVDPRFSTIASKADYFCMIRPGTDIALLLGWINYIIESGRYNPVYVSQYVSGFDELKEHVNKYSLDYVSRLTDIPADLIKATAEVIADSGPNTLVYPGKHSSWYGNDVERHRAQALLAGLVGAWNKSAINDMSTAPVPVDVMGEYKSSKINASEVLEDVLKDKTKFLVCWGQNPFHAHPHLYKTVKAFQKADFVVATDIQPTEAVLFADVVLPEASFLERTDSVEQWNYRGRKYLSVRFPMVEPLAESKDPYWIVKQLSSRLGKGKGFRFVNIKKRLDYELGTYGLSTETIFKLGGIAEKVTRSKHSVSGLDTIIPGTLPTPSGKVEFYSHQLEAAGFSAMPDFESIASPPAGYVRLLYGRSPVHNGSATTNNEWLLREVEENELWINDQIAAMIGIYHGEGLHLENQDGVRSLYSVKAKVTPGIRSDCVYLVHGFGSRSPFLTKAYKKGISDTLLMTRSTKDPISQNRGLRVNFVRLVKNDSIINIPEIRNVPAELEGEL